MWSRPLPTSAFATNSASSSESPSAGSFRLMESIGCPDSGTRRRVCAATTSRWKPITRVWRRRGRPSLTPSRSTKPTGDERQMRVAVARLDGALRGVEIAPALESIVRVAGALGKDPAQGLDVGRDATGTEARDQAAIEEAGRRVGRPVEAARKRREGVGVLAREARTQVDDLEAGSSRHLEGYVERIRRRDHACELEARRGPHSRAPTVPTLAKRRDDSQLRSACGVSALAAVRQHPLAEEPDGRQDLLVRGPARMGVAQPQQERAGARGLVPALEFPHARLGIAEDKTVG